MFSRLRQPLLQGLRLAVRPVLNLPVQRMNFSTSQMIAALRTIPVTGDTPLHIMIRAGKSADEVSHYLANLEEQKASVLTKTINNKGQLPFDVVPNEPAKHFNEMTDALVPHMMNHDLKPLTEPVSVDDILKSYYPNVTTEFRQNVEAACDAINAVRTVIKSSFTHPTMNVAHIGMQNYVNMEIGKMRHYVEALLRECGITCSKDGSVDYEAQLRPNMTHAVNRFFVGNCQEYAVWTQEYLANTYKLPLDREMLVERVKIENGDHEFGIFGRHPRSNFRDISSWGKDTVMYDAWAGRVFRAASVEDLKKNLCGFRGVELEDGKGIRMVIPFNPSYHRLLLAESIRRRKQVSSAPTVWPAMLSRFKKS